MWPFKKKDAKPAVPDHRMALIQQLEAWREIGQEFEYLGRRMIVSGHYSIGGGYPMGLYMNPGIRADYADDMGVIHAISFSAAESVALMTAQPNAAVSGSRRLSSAKARA